MAGVVFELTRGGIAAQIAVDAAMKASSPLVELCGLFNSDKEKDLAQVVLRILKRWSSRKEFPVLLIGKPIGPAEALTVELKSPKEMPILRAFEPLHADGHIPLVVTIVYLARVLSDILINLLSNESELGRARFPSELSSKENAAKFYSE